MEKSLFIGIDFSKKTFDVSVIRQDNPQEVDYRQFGNDKEGCLSLLKWVSGLARVPRERWLFCGEHTGLYSLCLAGFLVGKGLFLWLENPLQVKMSSGIKRDKSDKVDSREIALYAFRYRDRARAYRLPGKDFQALGLLLSFRQRLLANKHTLLVSAAEIRRTMKRDPTARFIYERSRKDIERLDKEIKEVERRMTETVQSNEGLRENYGLVSSIKGIALINTVAILVATQNFTRFENSRQFACYAGMAPFGKQSGTSLRAKPKVSPLADKSVKALLTQAAHCAIRHDTNLKRYYERKISEGKNERLVLNNVRNKMIHRIFALVRTKQAYQVDCPSPSNKKMVA